MKKFIAISTLGVLAFGISACSQEDTANVTTPDAQSAKLETPVATDDVLGDKGINLGEPIALGAGPDGNTCRSDCGRPK